MTPHQRALVVISVALVLDVVFGWCFAAAQHISVLIGLYCALANAVTVGGIITPSTTWGFVWTALECIMVVPLFAATFSLFTTGLTATHVRKSEKRIKEHISSQVSDE